MNSSVLNYINSLLDQDLLEPSKTQPWSSCAPHPQSRQYHIVHCHSPPRLRQTREMGPFTRRAKPFLSATLFFCLFLTTNCVKMNFQVLIWRILSIFVLFEFFRFGRALWHLVEFRGRRCFHRVRRDRLRLNQVVFLFEVISFPLSSLQSQLS